ncbi:MAG TPA: SBBP repeat-containing protein, partial [Verrucomicrobiae bacterium]
MQKLNLILGSTLLVLLFAGLSARAQVQQAWATTYDGDSVQPEQPDYDQVRAMAVDSAGRVHVTGQSYGSNGTPNIVTIQYSPEGRPLWIASYDAARDSDYPWAMVLDDFGNIYITGTSYGFTTGADVVTLKYDSSGNLLWASRYNGPANSSDSGNAVRV